MSQYIAHITILAHSYSRMSDFYVFIFSVLCCPAPFPRQPSTPAFPIPVKMVAPATRSRQDTSVAVRRAGRVRPAPKVSPPPPVALGPAFTSAEMFSFRLFSHRSEPVLVCSLCSRWNLPEPGGRLRVRVPTTVAREDLPNRCVVSFIFSPFLRGFCFPALFSLSRGSGNEQSELWPLGTVFVNQNVQSAT